MKKINIYACICYLNDLLEIRNTSAAVFGFPEVMGNIRCLVSEN